MVGVGVMPQDVLLQPNPPRVADEVGSVGEQRVDPAASAHRAVASVMLDREPDLRVEHAHRHAKASADQCRSSFWPLNGMMEYCMRTE